MSIKVKTGPAIEIVRGAKCNGSARASHLIKNGVAGMGNTCTSYIYFACCYYYNEIGNVGE